MEEEGEADGGLIEFSDEALGDGARAEEVLVEESLGGGDLVGELFVFGQLADELKDLREVGWRGGADLS